MAQADAAPSPRQSFAVALEAAGLSADTRTRAEAFFERALPDDLAQLTPELADAILGFVDKAWALRKPGEPVIRIETLAGQGVEGGRRMAIAVINDDMPFLVDSISAEIVAQGLTIHRLFHPILAMRRNPDGTLAEVLGACAPGTPPAGVVRESVIYLEVDRLAARPRKELADRLALILGQVRACVEDWKAMTTAVVAASAALSTRKPPVKQAVIDETQAFIDWLLDNNMTLLGYRYYAYADVTDETTEPETTQGLGLLRDPAFPVWRGPGGFQVVSPELRHFLSTPEPLMITKANAVSLVHRRVHMDYISLKAFDRDGAVVGEHRLVGLFTSTAYATRPSAIPVLRRKVDAVIDACGYDARSHIGKALVHVLETYPRDELFQIDSAELAASALTMLSLMERPRAKVLVRRDRFERFVSVLVFFPRDAYRADVRSRAAGLLSKAFNGRVARYTVELDDSDLARVHFIIRSDVGSLPEVSVEALDGQMAALVRGWDDAVEQALVERLGALRAARLGLSYRGRFSVSYRDQVAPEEAAADIEQIAGLKDEAARAVRLYRRPGDAAHQLRLKIYRVGGVIPLAQMVPVLDNFGLAAIEEYPFDVSGTQTSWIHDFLLETCDGAALDLTQVEDRLTAALTGVLERRFEDDAFNALVTTVGLEAEQVIWLRALFRYQRQLGLAYGLDTVRQALQRYGDITRALVDLFVARHHPDRRLAKLEQVSLLAIEEGLGAVSALDDDRILRGMLGVIRAIVRTNAFKAPEALAFKIHSRDVPGMPLPVPFMEIFVYSPRLEGIHLRGGKVARGGLRWSDRRDDFRTEILGLIKAQMVKNAVIVPVGAKGGFYPKQLPPASDREAWLAEGTECYRIYIRALLSITDNLVAGAVVPPTNVVRHDEDDPYLVVAADKGTATFSDIANGIAIDHGFWLGDAFASGGSNGYDHKKMGITAKGAWISVERHFREMGLNVATDPVRVIGVGDMSGDVFGNGLLRSAAVRLVAAFDHRHIFLDPDPDAAASFAERQRMFDLPRSSWADYDARLISAGGGVYPRSAKSVPLSAPVQAMLGVPVAELTPTDLIQAILKMEADLLWLGGIGTYIKAAAESDAQAGDKANDALRVNAEDLRVKVVGEGANLGVTQRGRIAFAARGGRINTDFIDNSAGVDCSDNEVNIKILLNPLVNDGKLAQADRDSLLVAMTDDVSALVLRDNYLQTAALSIEEARAPALLASYARLIRTLERSGGLNRAVEQLPSDSELDARAKAGRGLTRPELAVLLAYAKMRLYDALLDSAVPDAAVLQADLAEAFPQAIRDRFIEALPSHRLRREIIATKLANAVVNRGGPTLVFELAEASNSGLDRIAAAFVATRAIFDFRGLWRAIDGYDYRIPAATQIALQVAAQDLLRGQMLALVAREPDGLDLDGTIAQVKDGVAALLAGPLAQAPIAGRWQALAQAGAPADVLAQLASLDAADAAAPLASRAVVKGLDVGDLYAAFDAIGEASGLDALVAMVEAYRPADAWEQLAIQTLGTDLMQTRLDHAAGLPGTGAQTARAQAWIAGNGDRLVRLAGLIDDMRAEPAPSLAMFTHAVTRARGVLAVSD